MKKLLLNGILTALFFLVFGLTVNAQQTGNLKKKVIFPAGKSEAVFKGKISDLRTQQIYTVKVSKGKVLSVLLKSKERATTFNVFNSRENESIGAPPGEEQLWEDTMPATDDYSIIVTINDADITDEYILTISTRDKIE